MILVSLLFILGIVIQSKLELPLVLLGILTIILLSWIIVLGYHGPYILWILLIISGCLRLALVELTPLTHLSNFITEPDSVYEVRAVVQSMGETRRGTPKYLISPERIHQQVISEGRVILYAQDLNHTIYPGDTLVASMLLNVPRAKKNPHDFDYRNYLLAQDIFFEAFLDKDENVIINPRMVGSLPLYMKDMRKQISTHFNRYLTSRSAGILSALILGEKSEIEETTRNDFANTGVIHVLAVSGLHVGYVSIILVTLFGLLRLPHKLRMGCVIVGLVFYVALTGAAPSVMRASIMASLIITASLLERKSDILNILASAAFIILLIAPAQLYSIGFQLSFLAVLSIVALFPILKEGVAGLPIPKSSIIGKMIFVLLDLFLVSLAAQLGTLAITIFYFNKIPIISLLANLIVVPLIGVIVATGMSFLIIGALIPSLAQMWAATLEGTIDLMLGFVQLCASVEWAYVTTRSIQHFELIFLMLGIFSITILKVQDMIKLWLSLVLLWLIIQTWQSLLSSQHLEVVMLDVGQADAILVHAPNGKTILIDAGFRFGGKDMGKDVISGYLNYRNWSKIDLLVLTHPHNDHMGGAQYLIENIPVEKIMMPDIDYDSHGYKMLTNAIETKNIATSSVFAGHIDSSLKPIYFRISGPKRYAIESQPSNVNNASIVMQLFYGESSIMLTGDGEELVEHNQLPFGNLLKSELIKAPHHGSKTSSSQAYLDFVQPQYCIISLGANNKFRHPSQITLKKYKQLGAHINRTDLEGAIIYKSDGKAWLKHDWKIDN